MRWWARRCCHSRTIRFSTTLHFQPALMLRPRLLRIIWIGSRTRLMTSIGSSGRSRSIFRIFACRRCTSAGGMKIFLTGTLRNYMGIKAHGGSGEARNGQRLLIQIGGHAGFGRRIGDVEFGDEALKFSSTQVVLDWYDYLFK